MRITNKTWANCLLPGQAHSVKAQPCGQKMHSPEVVHRADAAGEVVVGQTTPATGPCPQPWHGAKALSDLANQGLSTKNARAYYQDYL